jgi:hypothetical protein
VIVILYYDCVNACAAFFFLLSVLLLVDIIFELDTVLFGGGCDVLEILPPLKRKEVFVSFILQGKKISFKSAATLDQRSDIFPSFFRECLFDKKTDKTVQGTSKR